MRSWHGWHRHITLVLAAQTFLTVLRYQAEPVINPPTPPLALGLIRFQERKEVVQVIGE